MSDPSPLRVQWELEQRELYWKDLALRKQGQVEKQRALIDRLVEMLEQSLVYIEHHSDIIHREAQALLKRAKGER